MTTLPSAAVPSEEFLESIQAMLARAEEVADDPERFFVYRGKPIEFAEEVLGIPKVKMIETHGEDAPGLTDAQCEILEAAVTRRRVTIKSGHGTGKTFVMAVLVIYWLYCEGGLVVTTASNWEQVEKVLWREIGVLWKNARVKLPGELLEAQLRITKEWFAIGVSTNQPTAFQGRHHPRLLAVVDEATGVDDPIHASISSLATDDENCIVQVGNPTETVGAFHRSHHSPVWHSITMSCLDHPNIITGRRIIPGAVMQSWIDEVIADWGMESAYWQSRVEGNFPTIGSAAVIPLAFVTRQQNPKEWKVAVAEAEAQGLPKVFGVDVARSGDNKTVLAIRWGRALWKIVGWSYADTMETVGMIRAASREYRPAMIVVDVVGLGGPVVDRLQELGEPVYGFHAGRAAADKTRFTNRRSEHWWQLRQKFESAEIWLAGDVDRQLIADLTMPTYKLNSAGKVLVQSKESMERSPDYADATAMAFLMEDDVPELSEQYVDFEVQDQWSLPPGESEDATGYDIEFFGLPSGF